MPRLPEVRSTFTSRSAGLSTTHGRTLLLVQQGADNSFPSDHAQRRPSRAASLPPPWTSPGGGREPRGGCTSLLMPRPSCRRLRPIRAAIVRFSRAVATPANEAKSRASGVESIGVNTPAKCAELDATKCQ